MRLPRYSLLIALAIVVVAAIAGSQIPAVRNLFGDKPPAAATARAAAPISVDVATVTTGPVATTVNSVGSLLADKSVTIQPEIAGIVAKVGFSEGSQVKADDLLIQLDNTILTAEVDRAEAALALALQNYGRAQTLAAQGSGTARARDEAAAALSTARAESQLARARLEKATIRAPFAGTVGLSSVTPGRFVAVGERIVNLESITPIKVDFRIPENFLPQLRIGQTIAVAVDAFPQAAFQGTVYAMDPLVDVNGRAVKLRARIPNDDATLKPGLFARVSLTLEQRPNAMLVPEAAIVPQGNNQYVYRVEGDKARYVKIRTGERRNAQVEVLEGLSVGDVIVVAGQVKLFDGAAVKVEKTLPPPPAPGKE
ncbi:MAG: efflux RND transporter periplasmic adaptor subunit [Reyranellaceae bacterium]